MGSARFEEKDFLACCGSTKFAKEMAALPPFSDLGEAVLAARDIWFNKVDVAGWLEAFSAHPPIGQPHLSRTNNVTQWSRGEQSTALATANTSTLQELANWNAQYRQKFGFVFLICAAGRTSPEVLDELKRRYTNRPIVEFEIAAQEQMKITELRLSKLFSEKANAAATSYQHHVTATEKAGDRMSVVGFHLAPPAARARPPITTHVLDIGRGCPAFGIDVRLEIWKGGQQPPSPSSDEDLAGSWMLLGSGTTDKDGRSSRLMSSRVDDDNNDAADPGIYRISFNTGKYNPTGFFPFVSIVFEIKESQKLEHFHVPLLLSPFSFSTYRGS
ncbi:hypothetical protein Dimus_009992 [Dionaea muscipula]